MQRSEVKLHLARLVAVLRSEQPPELIPLFSEMLKKYTGVLAGVVLSAAISPSISAGTDLAYKSLFDQRKQLIMQYEQTWKAANELEGQLDAFKHQAHSDSKQTNADLERTLKRSYADLQRVEQDIRDLDKSVVK